MNNFFVTLEHVGESDWINFEDFTETLTGEIVEFLDTHSPDEVKITFSYTSESSLYLIDNKWFLEKIHLFADRYKIPYKNITFRSSNVLIEETYNKWHKLYSSTDQKINTEYESFGFWLYGKNKRYYDTLKFTKEAPTNLRIKKFNCLNANMLLHRKKFCSKLFEEGLCNTDENLISVHEYFTHDFPYPEKMKPLLPIQFDLTGSWEEIYKQIFKKDTDSSDWNKTGDYRYIYENTYFTVTTESCMCPSLADYHPDHTINNYLKTFYRDMFITEKTTRPILNLHPQIIYSTSGTLEHLKSLGYKTFSDYWDESYDSVDDNEEKLNRIMAVVKELSNKPLEELHEMYFDMMPILKNNQEILINQ